MLTNLDISERGRLKLTRTKISQHFHGEMDLVQSKIKESCRKVKFCFGGIFQAGYRDVLLKENIFIS